MVLYSMYVFMRHGTIWLWPERGKSDFRCCDRKKKFGENQVAYKTEAWKMKQKKQSVSNAMGWVAHFFRICSIVLQQRYVGIQCVARRSQWFYEFIMFQAKMKVFASCAFSPTNFSISFITFIPNIHIFGVDADVLLGVVAFSSAGNPTVPIYIIPIHCPWMLWLPCVGIFPFAI